MRLKVFKIDKGKLRYVGIREVRQGDIIVEGETSMAETVHLKESKGNDINAEILKSLSGEEKANVKRGLYRLGMPDPEDRAALITSLKRFRPDWTDRHIEIFLNPKSK